MAFRSQPMSMERDDDDMLDRMVDGATDVPAYPPNLCFQICEADLEKAGGSGGTIGQIIDFSAMAVVESVHASTDGNRVELNLNQFAGADGKFFDLGGGGHIAFCDFELGKLDLDCDCEIGDTIHLIGEARLEAISRSQFGEMATLQVVKLSYEDESSEVRDGGDSSETGEEE